jgi:hypothetical protein
VRPAIPVTTARCIKTPFSGTLNKRVASLQAAEKSDTKVIAPYYFIEKDQEFVSREFRSSCGGSALRAT